MKRENNERKAFWFLLVWFVFVAFITQPHLSAQDDEMFAVEDDVEVGKGESAQPVDGDFIDDAIEDNGEDMEDGSSGELPALSADPVELLAKVAGIAKAGKHKDVTAVLGDHEDAVAESNELLAIYVEALMKLDKQDWNKINRYAKILAGKDKSSSIADYAQGMFFLNAKKPDVGKAIQFLSRAKSAKKPYPGASSAYYMAMVKRFWIIGLAVIILPVAVIVKKKKAAKKTVEIDILSVDAVQNDERTVAGLMVADEEEKKPATIVKKIKKIIKKKVVTKATAEASEPAEVVEPEEAEPVEPEPAFAKPEPQLEEPDNEAEPADVLPEEDMPVPEELPGPVKEIKPSAPNKPVEKTQVQPYRPGFSAVETVESKKPADSKNYPASFTSTQEKHIAEIEKIREITRPGRPATVPVDSELDSLWNSLSRRAMQGKISPQYRQDGNFSSPGQSSTGMLDRFPEPEAPIIDMHVTIDLSEESLRDDLVGKLKMMAIGDSELRELFAQKNPRHIPHLIEYVLTRPEPLRLAFVARELGNYEDPAVIDTLASLLYHDDDRVALAAVQGLEKTGQVTAVLHLCPFLKSEIPVLAQSARGALANFGAVKILQAFRELPSYPDVRIREAGVFVLSRMTGTAVEELLKKMLRDDSLNIRKSVILAMSYQKNPAYIDVLRDFFRNASEDDKTLARKAIVYLQGFVTRKK